MGDPDRLTTRPIPTECICNRNLEGEVRDVCLHYFGCLPMAERSHYFQSLTEYHKGHINERVRDVNEVRKALENDEETACLLKDFTSSMRMFRDRTNNIPQYERAPETQPVKEKSPTACCGIFAHMVLFKSSSPYSDPEYPQAWPNQMLPLEDLLYDKNAKSNPLMKPCERDMIRWFHLPSNNMTWVEVCGCFPSSRHDYLYSIPGSHITLLWRRTTDT
jgi:hypothetical protein